MHPALVGCHGQDLCSWQPLEMTWGFKICHSVPSFFWTRRCPCVMGRSKSVLGRGAHEDSPGFLSSPSTNNPSSRRSLGHFRPLSWRSFEVSGTAVGTKNHYSRQRVGGRLNLQAITQPALRCRTMPCCTWRVGAGCAQLASALSCALWPLPGCLSMFL